MGRGKTGRGGGGRGGSKPAREQDSEDAPRGMFAQSGSAGKLPPSDSESDASDEAEVAPTRKQVGRQNPNAGMMPPSDSDSESDEHEEVQQKAKAGKALEYGSKETEADEEEAGARVA